MGETWDKVRSFVRGTFVPAEATPSRSSTAATVEPPAVPTRTIVSPPPVYREVTQSDAASDLIRAVDTKTDLVRSRLDALEARVREQADRPATGALSAALSDDRLKAISADVASLRETVDALSTQQASVKQLAEELARHVADLGTAMTAMDQRVTEAARDVRDAQASADEALEHIEVSRSELQTWLSVRGREIGQRVAPLYVLTLIALLASLGSAAMAIVLMLD